MKLETIVTLVMMAVAIGAGLYHFSLWWVLIPAFFAGSLALSNSLYYPHVIEANQRGVLWYFPTMLMIQIAGKLVLAGITYAITGWVT